MSDVARRLARHTIVLAMLVIGLLLGLDLLYVVHGSLEEFPTAEQVDKVRTVTAVAAVVLILAEAGLWMILRGLKRSRIQDSR